MSDPDRSPKQRARAERLKAALRENLRRRKAQQRVRRGVGRPHDSAGIAADKPKG